MKLIISGSHGTGKTTLFNDYKKVFTEYLYVKEGARTLLSKMNKTPSTMDKTEFTDFQMLYFAYQAQIETALWDEAVIFDRCLIDILAYSEDIKEDEYKKLYKLFKTEHLTRYQGDDYKILFCKIKHDFDFEVDEIRDNPDLKYQKMIEDRIMKYFVKFGLMDKVVMI